MMQVAMDAPARLGMTYGDLFHGVGGATIGAMQAGLTPLWGIEYDAKIAAVANENLGGHVHLANVLDVDPYTLPYVDVLHASPPCPNFSQAKTDGKETALDKALAGKVNQFIYALKPKIFTLENVYQYRQSESWAMIQDNLFDLGYWVSIEHVNAADYGVPQTRQRLIVRAVLGGWVPHLPPAQPWIGWYEAIEDLVPTLPESQFANWQMKRLPESLQTCMVAQGGFDGEIVTAGIEAPAFTVTANTNQTNLRAFLVGGANTSDEQAAPGVGVSMYDEPTKCVNTNGVLGWRAWLIGSENACQEWGGTRYDHQPSMAITTEQRPRAFIVSKTADKYGDGVRRHDEPVQTIGANEHGSKAWLSQGKVVSMTPRALARFQSFPDWYKLPEHNKTLAARGIGNACPPKMMATIYEGLLNV